MSEKTDLTEKKIVKATKLASVFRNKLVAGILVVVPLVVTVWVINLAYRAISNVSAPLLRRLDWNFPGFAFLVTLLLILALGIVSTNMLGKKVLSAFEALLLKVPIAATVYLAVKQIMDSINAYGNLATFKRVVYIDYPSPGAKLIGFSTGTFFDEVLEEEMTSVILPTSPNPMTGFLIVVPSRSVLVSNMTMEQATKLIVSAGLIVPRSSAASVRIPNRAVGQEAGV